MCTVSVVNQELEPKAHTIISHVWFPLQTVSFYMDTVYFTYWGLSSGKTCFVVYRVSEGLVRLPQRIVLYFGGSRLQLGISGARLHHEIVLSVTLECFPPFQVPSAWFCCTASQSIKSHKFTSLKDAYYAMWCLVTFVTCCVSSTSAVIVQSLIQTGRRPFLYKNLNCQSVNKESTSASQNQNSYKSRFSPGADKSQWPSSKTIFTKESVTLDN